MIVVGAEPVPPLVIFTSRWYTPARRQPVCPAFREFASFSTVANGFVSEPTLLLEPSGEATRSQATLDRVAPVAPLDS